MPAFDSLPIQNNAMSVVCIRWFVCSLCPTCRWFVCSLCPT